MFTIQEKIIEHILRQTQEQRAVEEAPKILDPIQATLTAILRDLMNRPGVSRQDVRKLIQSLGVPLPGVHLKALKAAYQEFSGEQAKKGLRWSRRCQWRA